MLLRLTNKPRDYAWGSKTLIPNLLGLPENGQPQAEIWFGTHPTDPSDIDPGITDPLGDTLDRVAPEPLGFLVKFLAAAEPLSIQAHPTRQRAQLMFERENQLGLSPDDPTRNYRDLNHKPEILIAVTEFEALSGFRSSDAVLAEVAPHPGLPDHPFFAALRDSGLEAAMRQAFASSPEEVSALVASLIEQGHPRADLLQRLSQLHPGDPGLLVSVLLNYLVLQPEQAIYLPAGNVHAYLAGLGVEAMAASDNVLRGGLTNKHVDVDELLAVADFNPLLEPRVSTSELQSGVTEYLTGDDDFAVFKVAPKGHSLLLDFPKRSAAIVVCVAGSLDLSTNRGDRLVISQGEGAYVSEDVRVISVNGEGFGYLTREAN